MKAIVHTSGARTVGNYLLPFYPFHTPFVNIEVVSFQKIRGRYPFPSPYRRPSKHLPSDSITPKPLPFDSIPSSPLPSDSITPKHLPFDSITSKSLPFDSIATKPLPFDSITIKRSPLFYRSIVCLFNHLHPCIPSTDKPFASMHPELTRFHQYSSTSHFPRSVPCGQFRQKPL